MKKTICACVAVVAVLGSASVEASYATKEFQYDATHDSTSDSLLTPMPGRPSNYNSSYPNSYYSPYRDRYNQGRTNIYYTKDNQLDYKDTDLLQRIRSRLNNDLSLSNDARNMNISVFDGQVTLTGFVRDTQERTKVKSMVRSVQGVRNVSDQLEYNYYNPTFPTR